MNSIRQRLQMNMMMAGFVPLAIMVIATFTVLNKAVMHSEEDKVANVSTGLSRQVTEVMDRAARDLDSLGTNPLLTDPQSELPAKLKEMKRLVRVYEVFNDISLYGPDGYLLGSTTENHPVFQEYTSWFKKALNGYKVISPPQRRLGNDGLVLMVFLPVKSEDGAVRQVIKARLSFDRVMNLLQGVRVGQAGYVILLDQWGNLISGPDTNRLLEKFDARLKGTEKWVAQPVDRYTDPEGREYLYSSATLSGDATHVDTPWTLLVLKPMGEVEAVMHDTKLALVLAALATVIVAAGLGLLLSRKISRPLEQAGQAAAAVAGGNLGARMLVKGPRELRDLACLFNRMVEEIRGHREGLENQVRSRTESLRRNQEELVRTSAHLRAAINSTNNGFLVEGTDGSPPVVNECFLEALGVTTDALASSPGERIREILHRDWKVSKGEGAILARPIKASSVIDLELRTGESRPRTIHVFSAPVSDRHGEILGRVWTLQDLSEQRALEEGLRQSQKMEAVGQLAGGVAHDFNNLLTAILGNLSLIEMDLDRRGDLTCRSNLRYALRAGHRAAELVKHLLGFSRRSQMDLKPCDANHVLTEVREILTSTIDPRIRVELDLAAQPWRVMADLGLLTQVVMNMAVNSKDAMPDGGTLRVSTSNHTVSEAEARSMQDAVEGQFLRITVEDTGTGIPPEIQSRVFEPFFTTKAPGKGTGLGLATSFGIIKQLGGWINLQSRLGEGTRFDVFLPRSAAAEAQVEPARQSQAGLASNERGDSAGDGGETILIVDDEEIVRRVAETLFTRLGYRVLLAGDGLEALKLYEEQGHEIDLVLLDLTMPNLSGKETFRHLRERFDYVPVLICSGYLLDLNEFAAECGFMPDGFMQKPYRLEELTFLVRTTLDQRSQQAA